MIDRAADDRLRYTAKRLGLRVSNYDGVHWRLLETSGRVLCHGLRSDVEAYLAEKYVMPPRRRMQGGYRCKAVPPGWDALIDEYAHYLAAAGRREATLVLRDQQLRNFARCMNCPPDAVTADMIVIWFGQQTWSLEHRRSNRFALRGFFAWAYRAKRLSTDLSDVMPTMPQPQGVPRPAPDDAWVAALAAATPRVRLMLRLAAEAGLRRAEVAQVHTLDLIATPGASQLMVRGKGGKRRLVPLNDDLADVVSRGAAGHTPGSGQEGWLFPDGTGGHLTAEYVGVMVSRVLPEGFTMHTLRHRYATRAYRGTRNIRAVQVLLGHSSVATTQRYCAVDDDEMRAAMMAAL